VGDEVHPAATVFCCDCTSIPSLNGTPSTTRASWRYPRSLRHRVSAHWPGLDIMQGMGLRFRQPRVARVPWRIVARADSIGLVVRMPCQCAAGKSKKSVGSPRSSTGFCVAFGYLSRWQARKRSQARSASSRVSAIRICCSADLTPGWMAFGTAAGTLAVLPPGSAGAGHPDRSRRAPTGIPWPRPRPPARGHSCPGPRGPAARPASPGWTRAPVPMAGIDFWPRSSTPMTTRQQSFASPLRSPRYTPSARTCTRFSQPGPAASTRPSRPARPAWTPDDRRREPRCGPPPCGPRRYGGPGTARELVRLRLHCRVQQPAGTVAENPGQCVLEFPGLRKFNDVMIAHGGVPHG